MDKSDQMIKRLGNKRRRAGKRQSKKPEPKIDHHEFIFDPSKDELAILIRVPKDKDYIAIRVVKKGVEDEGVPEN